MKKIYLLLILLFLIMTGLVSLLVFRAHQNDLYFESENDSFVEDTLDVPGI